MSFLNPIGFLGLITLPVILILHLLRERQRRYLVSNLDLWSFLHYEVRGPRTRRIPLTWLLLFDLLVATLLSLAWAQPQVSAALPTAAARHRVILVDVSASMLAGDGGLNRFERARKDAYNLIDTSSSRDVITLIAFGTRARVVGDSRQVGIEPLYDALNALEAGETGAALREGLALGQAALDRSIPAEFFVFTDGALPDSALFTSGEFSHPLDWRFVGRPQDNQGVIALNTLTLGDDNRVQVFTRIGNFAGRPATRQVVLELDGRQQRRETIAIAPASSLTRVWEVETGPEARVVTVSLMGDDALQADDFASAGLQATGEINVALVADEPGLIQQAVQAIPGTQLDLITPQEYAASLSGLSLGENYDLTVFRGYLPPTWPEGNVLIVDPPQSTGGSSSTEAEGGSSLLVGGREEVAPDANVRIPAPHPLVDGIDFSGVRWTRAWELGVVPTGLRPILVADDLPLILAGSLDAQDGFRSIAVLLADLSAGNFVKHPAFPIFIAGVIDAANSAPLPPSFQTGESIRLPESGQVTAIRIYPPEGDTINLEQSWPLDWMQTAAPGIYTFEIESASRGATRLVSGANAGSVLESDLRVAAWVREVQGRAAQNANPTIEEPRPVNVWPWLLAAAVILLLLEARLAWRR